MPAKPPKTTQAVTEKLAELGMQIRAHRKSLRVSAITTAESAGMSRITLHRIERGEPSVTMGAYLNAMTALGMELSITRFPSSNPSDNPQDMRGWIPVRVNLDQYPQLKQLAWQVQGSNELRPGEAFDIYERNWRHIETQALGSREQNLIDALRLVFGDLPRGT